MKVGIAADHRGFKLKEKLKKYFNKKKIEFIDYGTDSGVSVDSFDYAMKVCEGIKKGEVDTGILICWTGNGMAIASNKVPGIMCAKVDNAREARLAKEHNDANVISFSTNLLVLEVKDIVDAFLRSRFLGEERLVRRVNKIRDYEASILKGANTEKKKQVRTKKVKKEE